MPDSKITALTSISTSTDPANDPLVIVDVSDTSMAATGTTKKVTLNQLLGASGTATLASATITGDLTVRTNKLAVTSTGVGIGTASPSVAADVVGSSAGATLEVLRLQNSGSGINTKTRLNFYAASTNYGAITGGFGASSPEFVFDINTSSGAFIWNNFGSEAMRLNSTGLGVGGSPLDKFTVVGNSFLRGAAAGVRIGDGGGYGFISAYDQTLSTAKDLVLQTGGGNVGIGVTPSAWSSMLALQVRGASFSCDATIHRGRLLTNAFFDGAGYKYIQTNFASMYLQNSLDGVQSWHTAPSGTAGQTTTVTSGNSYTITAAGGTNYTTFGAANNNVGTTFTATSSGTGNGGGVTQNITFTQAMTLDASGNLLVKKTASGGTTLGVELLATGQINGATVNQDNLNIYNTTAAAYRFYVNAAGTVFATNTTISAISDARFKENVQDIDVGLGAILALKPRKFDWKDGKGKNIKGDRGFIAQEFETVFPNLIDEWKENAPEGEAPYKSVRQDLIPVLVKAIQELAAEVNALKNA